MEDLHREVKEKIAALDPEIELIALEKAGPEALRIYVDHPGGVDLGLCERVIKQLSELSERWALEVSSPGLDRPLTKPAHYERYMGSRVRVRTREAIAGQKNFTGTIEAADEQAVRVSDERGLHEIPLAVVHRANLVPEYSEVSQ